MTGPEKIRLFKGIDIKKLIPQAAERKLRRTAVQVQTLWDGFFGIIQRLKPDEMKDIERISLTEAITSWFHNFVDVYNASDVTSYIHTLAHVPLFLLL